MSGNPVLGMRLAYIWRYKTTDSLPDAEHRDVDEHNDRKDDPLEFDCWSRIWKNDPFELSTVPAGMEARSYFIRLMIICNQT